MAPSILSLEIRQVQGYPFFPAVRIAAVAADEETGPISRAPPLLIRSIKSDNGPCMLTHEGAECGQVYSAIVVAHNAVPQLTNASYQAYLPPTPTAAHSVAPVMISNDPPRALRNMHLWNTWEAPHGIDPCTSVRVHDRCRKLPPCFSLPLLSLLRV